MLKFKFITLVFIFVTLFINIFNSSVYAQTDSIKEATNKELEVKVVVGTQSVWTKKIPITLYFVSHTNGNKIEVKWRIPSSVTMSELPTKYYVFTSEKSQSVVNYIKPNFEGKKTIVAEVIVYGQDSNYSLSQEVSIDINSNLEMTPVTQSYKNAKLLRFFVLTIVFLVVAVVSVWGVFFFVKVVIPKWLQQELNRPA